MDLPIKGRFWLSLPSESFRALFESIRAQIQSKCPELSIWHVGSSSISGMPGMAGVDLIAVSPSWPPEKDLIDRIESAGMHGGNFSEHSGKDGLWFFLHKNPSMMIDGEMVENIGCAFHLVANRAVLEKFLAFREYCRHSPQGFEAYKNVKIEAAAGPDSKSKIDYKREKAAKILALISDAQDWWKVQGMTSESLEQ